MSYLKVDNYWVNVSQIAYILYIPFQKGDGLPNNFIDSTPDVPASYQITFSGGTTIKIINDLHIIKNHLETVS
jgi:hypothetical protein